MLPLLLKKVGMLLTLTKKVLAMITMLVYRVSVVEVSEVEALVAEVGTVS